MIGTSGSSAFTINNIKVYQTPNLLDIYQSSIEFTSDTTLSTSSDYDPINLIQNIDKRGFGYQRFPIINA